MEILIYILFFLPILTFIGSLAFKNHQEKALSTISSGMAVLQMLGYIGLAALLFADKVGFKTAHLLTAYDRNEFRFGVDFYVDTLSIVYGLLAFFVLAIIAKVSKTYMHRESGYKRFYNHLLLFAIGLNLVCLSGNFETFFLGWEIVGIASFLLISFYRDRYLPVRNAMKVLSFYRMGDVALIAGVWFIHHMMHTNIMFSDFTADKFVLALSAHPNYVWSISLLFLFAAAVKSAQFPFSSWLPRAMEGPTVSSAIFYGSLSVHLGVFLLIRTMPIWTAIDSFRYVVGGIGLLTFLIGSIAGSVQATAKTQIAYSSLSQIGIIFVELALGLPVLALVHFVLNAMLRVYQLLVSPSIMSYLIHQQFFNYNPNKQYLLSKLPTPIRNTLYILAVKEFNLDYYWYHAIWKPLKRVGTSFSFLGNKYVLAALSFSGIAITASLYLGIDRVEMHYVSILFSLVSLIMIFYAWTNRQSALMSWTAVAISQLFFMLSIVQNHTFDTLQVLIYFSGEIGAFILGWYALHKVQSVENSVNLNSFHGHVYEHPRYALAFLISALTMIGFPISPTFLGYDLLFTEIEANQTLLLVLSSITFIVLELAVLRIYARVFLGQHVKTYHEIAFRSS
jgi:NADH:ubiquinone oxidoreductase subunit 5 (subunit L)/multisubunit Na+/H+ antiporter MnhA subunit